MKYIAFVFICLISLIKPIDANAWGREGHKIIGKIAYSRISDSVKDSIGKYLGKMSFEYASIWMDSIRTDHSYDYMRPWHYVNFPKDSKYDTTKTDNIVWALNKVITELEHKEKYSKDQIAFDLKVAIFLVGSIHQPLHVGYDFDKGGNTVNVLFTKYYSNLHHVWSEDIIDVSIKYAPARWQHTSSMSKAEIDQIEKTDVNGWLYESRSMLNDVYDFKDNTISEAYIKKNVPVIETQLLHAGLRLSHLLEHIFAAN